MAIGFILRAIELQKQADHTSAAVCLKPKKSSSTRLFLQPLAALPTANFVELRLFIYI